MSSDQSEVFDKMTPNPGHLASTLPNTPTRIDSSRSDHFPHKKSLGRIKSLNKIDIRSPLLTPGGNHLGLEHITSHGYTEVSSLHTSRTNQTLASRLVSIVPDTLYSLRNYYNDFTTIDWAKAFIQANRFNYSLKHSRWIMDLGSNSKEHSGNADIPLYYKTYLILSKWFLIVLIGFSFSLIAFMIDLFEILLVGFKHGYCRSNWYASQVSCCVNYQSKLAESYDNATISPKLYMNVFKSGYILNTKPSRVRTAGSCPDWVSWSSLFENYSKYNKLRFDFFIYVALTIMLAYLACVVTLSTKITGRSTIELLNQPIDYKSSLIDNRNDVQEEEVELKERTSSKEVYTACGSGVPEVKTILSGFVIRRFLGSYTLFAKTISLIFAIASGMCLGKEGPYVHLATGVGNIISRYFSHIHNNELLKKQILSASASAGVALAFGSPLGGVLFILEEINNYLPPHQLFQIFFCAISSTLFLKFLNPYGTGKTVLFELKYTSDWKAIELIFFVIIGIAGGVFGACFVKFVGWWPKKFRQLKLIKNHPITEVFLISLLTGLVTFWNPYTKQASSELVMDLATPCSLNELDSTLCPSSHEQYIKELGSLFFAFIVKTCLTFVTFGLKLPCGIYVPSMVAGALYGRIFAMVIQWINLKYNLSNDAKSSSIMRYVCSPASNECVDLGIYSMIGAGAFMAGVTRMNITLVTILFELTSSYTYVLPISISIAVANWSGGLLEKNSLYESLLISNDYPFMSPETDPLDPFVIAGDIINESDTFEERDQKSVHLNEEANNLFRLNHSTPLEHMVENDKLYIDISVSPYVSVPTLQSKLALLADKCLLDGCISLVKNKVCVGLLYFPELEFCLDKLKEFNLEYKIIDEMFCKLVNDDKYDMNDDIRMAMNHNANIIKNSFEIREIDYFNFGSTNQDTDKEFLNLSNLLNDLTNLVNYVDYSPIFLNYDSELSLAHLIFDKIGNRVLVLLKDGQYYGVLHKKVLIDYCRRDD